MQTPRAGALDNKKCLIYAGLCTWWNVARSLKETISPRQVRRTRIARREQGRESFTLLQFYLCLARVTRVFPSDDTGLTL